MHNELAGLNSHRDEALEFFSFLKKDSIKMKFNKTIDKIEANILEYHEKSKQQTEESFRTIDKFKKELADIKIKQTLVSKLLATQSDNIGLKSFRELLYGEFLDFANQENSLSNEAEMILKLQEIEKELEVISAYPSLHSKNILAIGGGFSAGKSEFISSFIESDMKLPIGLVPTTAIPTYVFRDDSEIVMGCTHKGGVVDFEEIDSELHTKLSHEFIRSFDFNLKDILPFMLMGIKMDFEHICFIDTPGYNPADAEDGYTRADLQTSKDFLNNANNFIWLIGVDANGTISANDLNFLSDLNLEDKKVYIVLNKADLKPLDDIEDILSVIEESLDDYDIEVEGISAYSSVMKKEYSYIGESLNDFLATCDIKAEKHHEMLMKLDFVNKSYEDATTGVISKKENINNELHSLSLDVLEDGIDSSSSAFARISDLKKLFSTDKEEKNIELLNKCMLRMKTSIDEVFKNE